MQSLQNNNQQISQVPFTILCWNILAKVFTKPQYFPYVKAQHLDYEFRIKIVKQLIRENQYDLLCLQEVDKNLDFFKFLESQNYSFHFRETKFQGILLAWRLNFQEVEWAQIDYDKLQSYDKDQNVYLTDHGCLYVKLRQKATNKMLVVANTHFFWNPHYEKVKFHQVCEALRHLKLYAGDSPMILAGDLNSQPGSPIVKLILTGKLENTSIQMNTKYNHVKDQLVVLNSVFDYHDGQYTNYTVNFKGTLDYIFFSEKTLQVLSKSKYMPESQMKKQTALPNSICPSDHIPLTCSLNIK